MSSKTNDEKNIVGKNILGHKKTLLKVPDVMGADAMDPIFSISASVCF